ncbi:hypothetical protein [Dysgonomonas sp. ZJ279]|uniref:hypothetical protein n=1 Tax=Dysgonomonas sp. ZJ279 TaxID=2709796 RepID=UPI0013EC5F7E|nr:hypothetical protein [Dysgonomonas sp. ZJ279]
MKIKLIIFSFSLGILLSCSSPRSAKNSIQIEQIETNIPVIILGDTVNNKILRCRIPLAFKATNSSSRSKYIQYIHYYYNENYGKIYLDKYAGGWKGSFRVSQFINNELKISDSGRLIEKEINNLLSQEFIIEPSYDIDTCKKEQITLNAYVQRMKDLGTNTLQIYTFKEFKEKNPLLIRTLLEGDSISFNIFNNENKSDTLIVLPIKY